MWSMDVISRTNSWVFASSSRWYAVLPLFSFCSSCSVSYCLIPPAITELWRLHWPISTHFYLLELKNTRATNDTFRWSNFSVPINSTTRHSSHLSFSLHSVLMQSKEITDVMQQHPHILSFILMTTFLSVCWDVDGKWKGDFLDERNERPQKNTEGREGSEIKMQITCCRNSSTFQDKFYVLFYLLSH